jgi:hypothetical protein
MATTTNYGWTLIDENTDPWFTAFNTLIQAADTSLKSVANTAAAATSVVAGNLATDITNLATLSTTVTKLTKTAVVLTFTTVPVFDASQGNFFKLAQMTANITSWSIINPIPGQEISIQFQQGSAAYYTVAGAASNIRIANAGVFTLTASAYSRSDILTFSYNGTYWMEIGRAVNLLA